jgi:DNA-binding beta-propeller fold protein YncE
MATRRRIDAGKQTEGDMPGLRFAGHAMAAAVLVIGLGSGIARAQLMIIGNDEKIAFGADGKTVIQAGGHDSLTIIDMSKPAALKIVATIPLDNSIVGPPTNLAITPNRELALVANSVNSAEKDGKFAFASDNRMFVIDLKASPPKLINTLTLGKKPSGMAINAAGTLALVTNRDDGSISVLSIAGKEVKITDTVSVGAGADQLSAVTITPDGKRALAAKSAANKIAMLTIAGDKVTYDKHDLPTGIFPYNVLVAPNGKLAVTADNGNGGGSDGNLDAAGVIDLEANPVRVIDHVTVGDSPEGLAISPKGNIAVTVDAQGSNQAKDSWFYHPGGVVSVLKIAGKKVTNVGQVTVGKLPEGAVFSADGSYLYVGNYIDQDLSVLKVSGDKVTDTGKRFKLPGHPASMRGGPQ